MDITVHGGILGTRILAGALARLLLQKQGPDVQNKYPAWGVTKRPWSPAEFQHAKKLRERGVSFALIGRELGRGKAAVHTKLMGRRAA